MRKYVITALFILLMMGSVFLITMPGDEESVRAENREPRSFPQISLNNVLNGTFAKEFDEFIDDNIGIRGKWIELSDQIRSHFGVKNDTLGKIVLTTKDMGTDEIQDSRLMIYDNKIMEMFESVPEAEYKYGDALNELYDRLPDDVDMYAMLIPTQLEFQDAIYAAAEDSQKDAIDYVYSELSGIECIDVYTPIKNAMAETDKKLYLSTDHHWTMDGSYYAYKAFMDAAGGQACKPGDFTAKSASDFYGTLYQKVKAQVGNIPKDRFIYYDVEAINDFDLVMTDENGEEYGTEAPIFNLEYQGYQIYFSGDQPFMKITNNTVKNGKTIVVVKDSYANALLPWLINSYETTLVIDPRSFSGNITDTINEYGAKEVVVINYVFTTTFNDYADLIKEL